MYSSAEEVFDEYAVMIAGKEHLVSECEVAIRSLNVAHDYLEEVLAERDNGDFLPASTDRSGAAIFERLTLIAERVGVREEILDRATWAIDDLTDERDLLMADFDQQQDAADEAGLDDVEDLE